MTTRLTTLSILLFVLIIHASCQNIIQQKNTIKSESFFQQISQLNEFKLEDKRIDSIKKATLVPVKISVEIIDSSFLNEDIGKNISLGFINEEYPFDKRVTYTIKFDKTKQKIISIVDNRKQLEKSDLTLPQDIPLPKKNN